MDKNVADRNRKTDIELILRPKEGLKPKDTRSLTDSRLFTGDNKLHAIMDTQTCLWYLQMDKGILPEPLHQKWTGLTKMLDYVRNYYSRRNIEIVEIRD